MPIVATFAMALSVRTVAAMTVPVVSEPTYRVGRLVGNETNMPRRSVGYSHVLSMHRG